MREWVEVIEFNFDVSFTVSWKLWDRGGVWRSIYFNILVKSEYLIITFKFDLILRIEAPRSEDGEAEMKKFEKYY